MGEGVKGNPWLNKSDIKYPTIPDEFSNTFNTNEEGHTRWPLFSLSLSLSSSSPLYYYYTYYIIIISEEIRCSDYVRLCTHLCIYTRRGCRATQPDALDGYWSTRGVGGKGLTNSVLSVYSAKITVVVIFKSIRLCKYTR